MKDIEKPSAGSVLTQQAMAKLVRRDVSGDIWRNSGSRVCG
jgi:hypothetical protein